jgi:isochorismate pyruvate lyase
MRDASQCNSIEEIRQQIDEIDENIIKLLGKRSEYVLNAAKFKKTVESVKAEDRVKSMLAKRRDWAQNNNLSADFIEKLYKNIVEYFISEEMIKWAKK